MPRTYRTQSVTVCLTFLLAGSEARAQRHTLDAAALTPEAAAVYDVWLKYLASKNGNFRSRANAPSPYWLKSEQQQWPMYELAAFYLLDGAVPNVLRLERVESPGASMYRIVTHFTSNNQATQPPSWWAKLTMTVYAVHTSGGWRLANALPIHTAQWTRRTVGPITYVHPPDYAFDSTRAQRAVAFTDSLATAFGVPRLARVTYYLTRTVDEVYEIMGLESEVKFGPVGGAAQPVNRQLFSGIPAIGEEYRHELAHLVLAPLCCARTSYFVSEGVPTWLGGTATADYATAVRSLAEFLSKHPSVSLDSLMTGMLPAQQMYPAAAVIAEMVFRQRGVEGVKALFAAGGGADLRTALEHLLTKPWPAIVHDWRGRVSALGALPQSER